MAVRLISAGVGSALAILVLFLHDTVVLNIAVAAIVVLMLYELFKAGGCSGSKTCCAAAYIYGAVYQFTAVIEQDGSAWAKIQSKAKILIPILFIIIFFFAFILRHNKMKYTQAFFMIGCTLLVSRAMSSLIMLEAIDDVHGVMYLTLGLCGAWLADSGAYFAGTFLGKHKLCPEVSPKKTVEGFIGGIITNGLLFMLISFGYSKVLPHISDHNVSVNYPALFIIGAVLAVVGTVGDLTASVVKRQCGIKDYGSIMPGHGGAMDRFDSILFVAPCFYAFSLLVKIYS